MNPLPLRITVLPSTLALPDALREAELPAALILFTTLFEHFLRHPRVAMIDPDDFAVTDAENCLLTAQHPRIGNVKAYEFYENRRDEIVWFEISLDPARPAPVRLKAERFGGHVDDFVAIGSPNALGESMQNCINQWLAARGLPPAPRPIESFGIPDFLQLAESGLRLVRARAANPQGHHDIQVPQKLAVPYCRFTGIVLGVQIWELILRIEADNPWALRDQHLERWHKGGASRDEIRQVIAMAPAWGKPYGVLWGEGVKDDEWLWAASIDAALIPGNYFALDNYACALRDGGRREEAFRQVDRATTLGPTFLLGHYRALDLLDDSMRYGQMQNEALYRLGQVDELIKRGRFQGAEPDICHLRLRFANALYNVGRVTEACQVRSRALDAVFNPTQWPKMREVLAKWQNDPQEIAGAYAREGYFRGEPGRVIEGLGKTVHDRSDHIAMLIESLIAVGRHDLALLEFARVSRTRRGKTPLAWLAGARAHLVNNSLAPAAEFLASFQIRAPQEPFDTEVNRLLRVAASYPLAEWEAVVRAKMDLGARRVAALIARDALDFVPRAAESGVLRQAVPALAPVSFDPASLDPLRKLFAGQSIEPIDQLFATYSQPTLEHADKLVTDWLKCAPLAGPNDDAGFKRYAAQLLFSVANALTRYLALSTQPSSPLAGAYSTVATEPLAAIPCDRNG